MGQPVQAVDISFPGKAELLISSIKYETEVSKINILDCLLIFSLIDNELENFILVDFILFISGEMTMTSAVSKAAKLTSDRPKCTGEIKFLKLIFTGSVNKTPISTWVMNSPVNKRTGIRTRYSFLLFFTVISKSGIEKRAIIAVVNLCR